MSKALPAPKVEIVEVARLKPFAKNPRKHHAVDAIARSMEKFGYLAPIIVQAGTYRILAGHGRLEAVKRRGVDQVPVIVAEISDADADLYTIADNKLGEMSEWDEQLLGELTMSLIARDLDLSLTGFSEKELEELANPLIVGGVDEDELIEPEAEAVTKLGDLWELGRHLVYCGDSTQEQSYRSVLSMGRADLVFTDPPYGVDYKAKKFDLIKNDELKGTKLMEFLFEAFSWAAFHAKEDAAFYVWHASSTREDFAAALKMAGLIERQYLIWVKPSIVLGHADYQWQHEPCFYAHRQGESVRFFGARDQATVWRIAEHHRHGMRHYIGSGITISAGQKAITVMPGEGKGKIRRVRLAPGQAVELGTDIHNSDTWEVSRDPAAEHPTQKPVELSRRAIMNSSQPDEVVLDPFLGSGSTLIGCEATGRKCRGIELSPNYVDVIVRRWQRLTGEKAKNLTRQGVTLE